MKNLCRICNKPQLVGNGSFFKVPRDERRKVNWCKSTQMCLTNNDFICEDHFVPSDIIRRNKNNSLMPNAVPFVPHSCSDQYLCAFKNMQALHMDPLAAKPEQQSLSIENQIMVCTVCSKNSQKIESNDCFEIALESIKQHYNYYKHSIGSRDLEIIQLKERNIELLKALDLLQKSQQPRKKFKTNVEERAWLSPHQSNKCASTVDDPLDISITDDDDLAVSPSNLNMAINSEQLFDTSALSPAANVSNSERISPQGNKQKTQFRSPNHRNKILQKTKSEVVAKESSDKSWTSFFVKPAAKGKLTDRKNEKEVNDRKNEKEVKIPEKKLNLSLKKVNPSKIKQSLLHFNNSKDSNIVEPDVCDDIIDASPAVIKHSKVSRSRAQRSGLSLCNSFNTAVPTNDENMQDNEEDTTISVPIENIVFDFSPSKKSDNDITPANITPERRLISKQLNFIEVVASGSSGECVETPADGSSDSSSVVILTPATQDVIFVDDTCNEISLVDTMDLLADIRQHDNTEAVKKLQRYESKNIEKRLRQEEVQTKTPKEKKLQCLNPIATVKKEKVSQKIEAESLPNKCDVPLNRLLQDDDEEEDDAMPRPFFVKEEAKKKESCKKSSLMERFNIKCTDCEKYLNFFGDRLSDAELAKHINQCTRHKQPDDVQPNTPDDFWNPFILSFAENDPRNEVLIDHRSKDKKQMGKL